jgi:MSHA biogenesis protein MshO
VSAAAAVFIRGPVDAYVDQVRRADLVDSAEMALRRMAVDVRRAVPNSVRIEQNSPGCPAGQCLEMLNAVAGARYRDQAASGPGGGNQAKRLRFNQTDDAFNVQGPFPALSTTTHWLVVYNLGSGDADAYAVGGNHNVVTQNGTTITITADTGLFAGERNVTLSPPHRFRYESPGKRIYLVDKPVMYRCAGGSLWRYEAYGINPTVTVPGSGGQLVARNVVDCDFGYDAGTSTRAALVTMRLTLARDGETVTLMHQVHVENSP